MDRKLPLRVGRLLAPLLLALGTAASPAYSQPTPKAARIGMLCPTECKGIGYDAFDDELRKLGWVEGRNLTVDRRGAQGRYERLPELAGELLRAKPDVLVTASTEPTLAAKNATSDIPIAFSFVGDPVGVGLVESLPRPGRNVTGVAAIVTGEFIAKTFEIAKELLPNAKRVAVLSNAANETARRRLSLELPLVRERYGFQVEVIEVGAPEDVPRAIEQAKLGAAEALVVLSEPVLITPPNRIPDLVARAGIPTVYQRKDAVQAGGLIGLASDVVWIARRHAHFVDRLLRGSMPSELPVEQPTKYDLALNLKTAASLGLTIPPTLLARADEVIE
jgi:putative ABC transport system substrate-binding protein